MTGLKVAAMSCARDLVLAVDEPELPLRLGARRIEHALAVGGEQPVLLGVERVRAARIVRTRSPMFSPAVRPMPRKQWIGAEHLAHAGAEVVDGLRIVDGVGDAVLAVDAVGEDVPRHDVELDVAILRVLHHAAPEVDLLFDGELLDDFLVGEHRRRDDAGGARRSSPRRI